MLNKDDKQDNNSDHDNQDAESKISTSDERIIQLKKISIPLPRRKRWLIFSIFVILNIMINVDHGTVPAATEEIKKDLNINDEQLGLFGSLVYLGNMFGSLVSLTLINKLNRKYLLAVSLTLSGGFLMTFTIWSSLYFLFSNRIVVGMFQAFVSIYLPIWCDQFGIKRQRTIMIALIQVAPPLGVVLGYAITILCQKVIKLI